MTAILIQPTVTDLILQRNPDILLYGLPWTFPGWVGDYGDDPYKNVTKTASYVVKWVQGAKRVYNLAIDFIGVSNFLIIAK